MFEFERDKEKAMVKGLRDRIAFLNMKIAQADHMYISFATDIVRKDGEVCVSQALKTCCHEQPHLLCCWR